MGKRKNNKDRNRKTKLDIKREMKSFDETLIFEVEEEFTHALKQFLEYIKKENHKRYISSYITYIKERQNKLTKQLERKKNTPSEKKEKLKMKKERYEKILSYLYKELEKENNQKKKEENISLEEKRPYENIYIYLKENDLDDLYIETISHFLDQLCLLEQKGEITKKEVEESLYTMIDILHYKIKKIDKNHQKEREDYKKIKRRLEMFLEVYKEVRRKPKHDYYYDILEVLLNSPQNYYVIEKLLENIKEFVNAKKTFYSRDGSYQVPILYTIIDLYIRNYKLELRGQTKDFVTRNYYRKLYYLFIQNPFLEIDKKNIKKMLDDFISSLDNAKYLRNNKDQIRKEVNAMLEEKEEEKVVEIKEEEKNTWINIDGKIKDALSKKRERMDQEYLKEIAFYYEKIKSELINPTKEDLKQIQRTLDISNRTKRNITLGCETIAFSKDHSYTLSYEEDGSYSFRMNTLDLCAIIENTPLEGLVSKSLDTNTNILVQDKRLQIEEKKQVPSITYEVRIEQNGKVGGLKIYRSVSEVEKMYSSIEQKDNTLKSFLALYKMMTDDHKPNLEKEEVDSYFLSFFTNQMIEYAKERNLPLIVKGKSDLEQNHYMQLHYELCETYTKIKKEHFEIIFDILKTNLDKSHFVNHDYELGTYHIHLENDYVKYWNQKMLMEYVFEIENENLIEEGNEVLARANNGISYIGVLKPIDKKNKVRYNKK